MCVCVCMCVYQIYNGLRIFPDYLSNHFPLCIARASLIAILSIEIIQTFQVFTTSSSIFHLKLSEVCPDSLYSDKVFPIFMSYG